MNSTDYQAASRRLLSAVGRHQKATTDFDAAYKKLMGDIVGIAGRWVSDKFGAVFDVRKEKRQPPIVVVKGRFAAGDPLTRRVLNFHPSGLDYFPGSRELHGCALVVLSDGDYVQLMRQAQGGWENLDTLSATTARQETALTKLGDITFSRSPRALYNQKARP